MRLSGSSIYPCRRPSWLQICRLWSESSLVMNIKIYLGGQGWFESSLVMNIKINLGGWGWFESRLLVMNIKIYLGGWRWFESSLVMNIKIYLGDWGWFETSLAMNIKIYLGGQGWFGRRWFFSSSGPHLWKIPGFAPSIHLKPRWPPTENKENVNSLYIYICIFLPLIFQEQSGSQMLLIL